MPDTPAYVTLRKHAAISPCGRYRYTLSRFWGEAPAALFVMLNPSTADADLDDPTIRRCLGFARREGLTGVAVMNLYAYRATNPKALLTCDDPVGPLNDSWLVSVLTHYRDDGNVVVAAWGANAKSDRVAHVLDLVPGVIWHCLGTTKEGHPRHPLYVKGDQPLIPFARSPLPDSDPSPTSTDAGE